MDKTIKKTGLLGFIQVLLSNGILILLGIISSFLIPVNITPTEFGYWQTYLLYDAYVGLAIFGYCDGIYLRYGGYRYEELPRRLFASLFYLLFAYLSCLSLTLSALVTFVGFSPINRLIFYAVAVSMLLRCLISYFVLINQATARFKIYSIGNTVEKVTFVIFIVVFSLSGYVTVYNLIFLSLAGQCVALLYNMVTSWDLVNFNRLLLQDLFSEVKANVYAGFPLTLYGISSMLMTGIGKFSVDHFLGKEQFGYYSFSFPMMAVISQVIAAASLVLFPMLRRGPSESVSKFLYLADRWTLPGLCLVMLTYIPVSYFVNLLLSKYTPALSCVLILLPMIFFQAKISMVYNTVLKIKRKEKDMMTISILALFCCLIFTGVSVVLKPSLEGIAFSTTLSYFVWLIMLRKKIKEVVPA